MDLQCMCMLYESKVTEVRMDFPIWEAEVLRDHKGKVHFLDPKISLSYGNNTQSSAILSPLPLLPHYNLMDCLFTVGHKQRMRLNSTGRTVYVALFVHMHIRLHVCICVHLCMKKNKWYRAVKCETDSKFMSTSNTTYRFTVYKIEYALCIAPAAALIFKTFQCKVKHNRTDVDAVPLSLVELRCKKEKIKEIPVGKLSQLVLRKIKQAEKNTLTRKQERRFK